MRLVKIANTWFAKINHYVPYLASFLCPVFNMAAVQWCVSNGHVEKPLFRDVQSCYMRWKSEYLYTMNEPPHLLKPPRRHSMFEHSIESTKSEALFVVAVHVITDTIFQ